MKRQTVTIEGTYNPTLDVGVVLVDTSNSPAEITLPNIENSTADDIGYKLVIQDLSGNASNNNIIIKAALGDLINGQSQIIISTNGGSVVFEPFANIYWVGYPLPSSGSGGGDEIGIIEVPITLQQNGTTYNGKMSSGFNVLKGDGSNFSIATNAFSPDTIKSTSNEIIAIDLIYYFQCISQGSNRRAFASLFAGARATGGAASPAVGQNNYRFPLPMTLGYAEPNSDIFTSVSWNGAGVLTLNAATLTIYFKN
jgi:hypothetical protein